MRPSLKTAMRSRHRQRLLLVVRHEDERDADLALDLLELDLHLLAQLEVERAERLVEQQHLGAVDEGAGERDALALAAGELRGLAVAVAAEPDRLERLRRAPARARPSATFFTRRPYSTFSCTRHVREERVVLEDGVDVAVERRQLR